MSTTLCFYGEIRKYHGSRYCGYPDVEKSNLSEAMNIQLDTTPIKGI